MNIALLDNWVLVLPVKPDEHYSEGIYRPQTAREREQRGTVKGIGDKEITAPVEIGDEVIYQQYAGIEWEDNGVEHLIIRRSDIIGILSRQSGNGDK